MDWSESTDKTQAIRLHSYDSRCTLCYLLGAHCSLFGRNLGTHIQNIDQQQAELAYTAQTLLLRIIR